MASTQAPGPTRERLLDQAQGALDDLISQHWRQGPGSFFARHDLTGHQVHLLMLLQERGPATAGQLAETLGISPPSISSALDRLEEHGLAVRERDLRDRRVVHAVLSRRGRSVAEEACGFKRQRMRWLLSQFDEGELRALLTVLEAVRRSYTRGAKATS
ncbi:MAG: MarR family winged helix-turn-helix transcriptional regulator [Candidatus Dormibacteria bacterium]